MARIVLIRAGRTDYDDQQRVLGILDMPVNDRGSDDINEIIRSLRDRGIRPDIILASPDDPANATAHAVAEALQVTRIREPEELKNVNQGLWQGLCETDVRRRFPRVFRNGGESGVAIRPPEGETLSDACQRLDRVLEKTIRRYDVVAVVAPEPLATVIRCTLQQRIPRAADCLCGEPSADSVVIVDTQSFDAEAFVSGEVPPVLQTAPRKQNGASGPGEESTR